MGVQDTGTAGTAGAGPGSIRDATRDTVDSVRHEASRFADRATDQGKSMLARRKDEAARRVESVADALRGTARELDSSQQSGTGRYVDYAAERLQTLGHQLRHKDVDSLIHDAQDLGRRAPGAFFAGSVVTGFLLARFLKASSERSGPRGEWHAGRKGDADAGPESGSARLGSDDAGDRYRDDRYRGAGTGEDRDDRYGTGAFTPGTPHEEFRSTGASGVGDPTDPTHSSVAGDVSGVARTGAFGEPADVNPRTSSTFSRPSEGDSHGR